MTEVQAVAEEQGLPGPDSKNSMHADAIELAGDADDRSSSLSDIEDRVMADVNEDHIDGDSVKSEEDDTEAETERLEASPQKVRRQKLITLKPMQAEPSKNMILIDEQVAEEEPTSSISSLGDSVTSGSPHSPQTSSPKKRKRSTAESVDSEEDETIISLNKVSKNLAAHLKSSPSTKELDVLSRNAVHQRKSPSNAPVLSLPRDRKSASASESRAISTQRSPHAFHEHDAPNDSFGADTNRNNGRRALDDENATVDGNDGAISNDEDAENADGEVENDVEVALQHDEEAIKKTSAMRSLNELEQCFAHLRDKLYDDRLAQLNDELNALKQPIPKHPEYLAMMKCVDKKRDDQVEWEQELYRLKSDLIKRNSVADRSVAIGQYIQAARQIREIHIEKANEEWYQLQRERRNHNSDQTNYTYGFRKKRSQQIANQISYNNEVSILSGIAKHVGFPAAPEITGARQSEIDDDLKIIEDVKARLYPTVESTRRGLYDGPSFRPQKLGRIQSSLIGQARNNPIAEEQFLEQTPWANPQHPAHQQQQMHPAFHRFSHQQRPRSPYSTPTAQQRNLENVNHGSASTIPDGFSAQGSSMAATPATVENSNLTVVNRVGGYQETPSRPPTSGLQHSLLNGTPSAMKTNGLEEVRAYVAEAVPGLLKNAANSEPRPSLPHKFQSSEPQASFDSPLNSVSLAPFQSNGI